MQTLLFLIPLVVGGSLYFLQTLNDPANFEQLINSVLNVLGLQVNDNFKAFITTIIILVIRFIEKRNLKDTITRHEQALDTNQIPIARHKTLFRKVWELIRFKRFN